MPFNAFRQTLGEKYSVFPSGELHVRALPESFTGYRCKIRNLVNNQTKLSSQGSIIVTGLCSQWLCSFGASDRPLYSLELSWVWAEIKGITSCNKNQSKSKTESLVLWVSQTIWESAEQQNCIFFGFVVWTEYSVLFWCIHIYTYALNGPTDPSNSITPRIIDCPSIMVVEEGTDLVELPCAAQAKPAPTYRLVTIVLHQQKE